MNEDRFERNVRFFGQVGQAKLRATKCAIVGVGGLGTHLVQQLSLLGVGGLHLIDSEELDEPDRNRYVGARHDDPVPGSRKVDLGERLVKETDPTIEIVKVHDSFITEAGFAAIRGADYIFGCLDCEGARLILTELCAAYARPYFDLATEIIPGPVPEFGGRICLARDGNGCLVCLDVIDGAEAGRDLGGEAERRNRKAVYGLNEDDLGTSGPSVATLNGIIASHAATEFMVFATGVREPVRLLTYSGRDGKVRVSQDTPLPDCWYCKSVWGRGQDADVERYVRNGVGRWIR